MTIQRQSAVLLIPMSIAWVLDVALTLSCQPAGYWAGDYTQAEENTKVFYLLLDRHPLLFLAGNGVYFAVSCFATLAVRLRLGRYIAMVVSIGHAWAVTTWLWLNLPLVEWFLYGGPLVLIGVCLMACLECSIQWEQDAATMQANDGGPAGSGTGWPDPQDALS